MSLSLSSSVALTKLTLNAGKYFIERWSAHRRDRFYESLLESLQIEQASGERSADVDAALDSLLSTDEGSELLYDAYRRVCFSKTKNYGPRIIGLLTAELLNSALTSNDEEEMIFEAAEKMGDLEFIEFKRHYEWLLEKFEQDATLKRSIMRTGDEIIEIAFEEGHEVGSHRDSEAHIFPPDLRASHGSWAARLESFGLLSRSVTQQTRQVKEDSERHIDYDQTWVFTIVTLTYKPAAMRLYQLLLRAKNE